MEQIIQFISNHPILCLAWIGLFIAVIYLTIKMWLSKVKEATTNQAVDLINRENGIVVDIRNHDQFKKGHIAGAYNILPVDIRTGNIHTINKFKSSPVIVTCENGLESVKIANELTKSGFEHIYVLKDGLAGWRGQNLPLVKKGK